MTSFTYREAIDRTSPIPVYLQIANDMTRRIADEEWRIGDQIMPEITLSELYDSSRVTMRQALARLEEDGLISRKRGGRAVVIARPRYMVQELQFPGPENKLPLVNPTQQVVSTHIQIMELDAPARKAAKMLNLQEDAPLIYLERYFENDEQVVGIKTAAFPPRCAAGTAAAPPRWRTKSPPSRWMPTMPGSWGCHTAPPPSGSTPSTPARRGSPSSLPVPSGTGRTPSSIWWYPSSSATCPPGKT